MGRLDVIYSNRMSMFLENCAQKNAWALYISDPPTLAWLGRKGREQVLLSVKGEELPLSPAPDLAQGCGRRLGVVGTFGVEFANALVGARQHVVDCRPEALAVRRKKDDLEVALLSRAATATRLTYARLPQVEEARSEVHFALELEKLFIENGGTGRAYETSVATGVETDRIWSQPSADIDMFAGSHSVVDAAAEYRGYKADCSLTLGAVAGTRMHRAVIVVSEIIEAVASSIRRGDREAARLVEICNESLRSHGYADLPHALGHGLGLDLHEHPFISRSSNHILTPGDVFMIEPAVYLPGIGGVRLESMFRLDADGELVTLLDSNDLSHQYSGSSR